MQTHNRKRSAEVVVYHSAYGLRPAIIEFADKLRAAGHVVHTPDLYDSEVFSDRMDAIRKIQELGFDIRDLGWKVWPPNVPVQVHFADRDPIRNQAVIDALGVKVRESESDFEQFDYEAVGHLFTDPAFPAYNANATELMTKRVMQFLEGVHQAAAHPDARACS